MRGQLNIESEMIFMPRHARGFYDTSFFHVIVQGIAKEFIFESEKCIGEYLRLVKVYEEETDIDVLAYCIMNNHAHLLVYTPAVKDMSGFMKKVNTMYAKFYNGLKEIVGYVFRDRFLSEPIKDEGYLIKCINYIHNNPVKAGMVDEPKDYKFSSYNDFINGNMIKKLYDITGILLDKDVLFANNYSNIFADIDVQKNIDDILKEITNKNVEDLKKDKAKL